MGKTFTVTFCETAENHVGQQQISEEGFSIDRGLDLGQLESIRDKLIERGAKNVELIDLKHFLLNEPYYNNASPAYILVVRNGLNELLDGEKASESMFKEHDELEKDSRYFDIRRNRVLNKLARHNVCFDDVEQSPDYENKKGTIVAFNKVPITSKLRCLIAEVLEFPEKAIKAEGNYYYDISKCGIGFHGDTERRLVVGARMGESLPLDYQWFYQCKPIGSRCRLILGDGDIYFMSDKAVGYDWKKRSMITLRHAAGCEKYLTIAPRSQPKAAQLGAGKEEDVTQVGNADVPQKIKNPKTGKHILIGKGVYQKLIKEGYVVVNGELIMP